MIRELCIAAVITGAAMCSAPSAFGDQRHFDTDVPGMDYDASLTAPCFRWDRFIFGRGTNGEALACHFIPNQWPPAQSGYWQISYPLYGVQQVGAPCPGPQSAAQAPDGLPLLCLGPQGWQAGWFTGNGFFPPD